MRKLWLAAVAAAVVGSAGIDAEAGKDIQLKDLPVKAREGVLRETKGGTITDIEMETSPTGTWYEVEYKKDGKAWEIDIDPNGKLLARRPD